MMTRAQHLTKEQLVELINRVQELLFMDMAPTVRIFDDDPLLPGVEPGNDFWNPNKEWNGADTLDGIRDVLNDYGLVPTEPLPFD